MFFQAWLLEMVITSHDSLQIKCNNNNIDDKSLNSTTLADKNYFLQAVIIQLRIKMFIFKVETFSSLFYLFHSVSFLQIDMRQP